MAVQKSKRSLSRRRIRHSNQHKQFFRNNYIQLEVCPRCGKFGPRKNICTSKYPN